MNPAPRRAGNPGGQGVDPPFFREVGTGQGVVCLHANASTSGQWRELMTQLGSRFHVLAADLCGAGRSPAWPADRGPSLRDEVELLAPVFARAGDPFALVGHSYGGAVALIAARSQPERVGALVLYEPTLFALVDAVSPPPNDVDGIKAVVAHARSALDCDNPYRAAELFIDYWMGPGAWAATPPTRQAQIAPAMGNVGSWASALLDEPTPLSDIACLPMPVLLMTGSDSPPASLAVARLLAQSLSRAEVVQIERVGHMGPVTHPALINAAITTFLERALPSTSLNRPPRSATTGRRAGHAGLRAAAHH